MFLEQKEPNIEQVRNICQLATLDCYYHNVAKSTKEGGAIKFLKSDRQFWIEYTGIATLGIDMSEVEMSVKGDTVTLTMPNAKVLGISIDEKSLNENSYIYSQDSIIRNKITAEDQTNAIDEAQINMRKTVEANSGLLLTAQERAQKLIENYIEKLGEAENKEYTIVWKYTGKQNAGSGQNTEDEQGTVSQTSS